MNDKEKTEYDSYVRGAATFILVGNKNPPLSSAELARLYQIDIETVNADIDAIVRYERQKPGGVFEAG